MFQSAKMKWEKGMNDKSKSYSLLQRWEWDVQMFKEGAKAKIASPQCETCSNWIKGDVYHCKHYKNQIKPKGVVSAKKNVFIILQIMNLKFLYQRIRRVYGGLFGFCLGML